LTNYALVSSDLQLSSSFAFTEALHKQHLSNKLTMWSSLTLMGHRGRKDVLADDLRYFFWVGVMQ